MHTHKKWVQQVAAPGMKNVSKFNIWEEEELIKY